MNLQEKYNLLNSLIAVYKSRFKSEPQRPNSIQIRLSNIIIKLSKDINADFKDAKYFHAGLTSVVLKSKNMADCKYVDLQSE